jgi:pyocin large subunit-like protein
VKDTKPKPETPPLTRAGRKIADATLAAAKFSPTSDGKGAIRQFEVHGMVVTERVSAEATPSGTPPEPPAPRLAVDTKNSKDHPGPQTPPLSRQGRKVADATLAAAKFVPSSDGKNAMRKFEVHGMAVTEFISAEKAGTVKKTR